MIKAFSDSVFSGTAVAIGNFDGVHMAHALLIKDAVRFAASKKLKSAVYTFYPHPSLFFGKSIKKITSEEDKDGIIEALGADILYKEHCDREFLSMSAEDFAAKVLKGRLGAKAVFVGYDFTFGRNSEGTAEDLKALGEKYGFSVTVMPKLQTKEGVAVKSTAVRELIEAGDMENAAKMLGRPHFYTGTVVKCKGLGKKIGFPTANIYPEEDLVLPPFGVYAVKASVGGEIYGGVANIGVNPTVENGSIPKIETHIFGFDKNIYSERIKISFLKMIRREQAFCDTSALSRQIKEDEEGVKKIIDKLKDIW